MIRGLIEVIGSLFHSAGGGGVPIPARDIVCKLLKVRLLWSRLGKYKRFKTAILGYFKRSERNRIAFGVSGFCLQPHLDPLPSTSMVAEPFEMKCKARAFLRKDETRVATCEKCGPERGIAQAFTKRGQSD
jgi:hypothetical protein